MKCLVLMLVNDSPVKQKFRIDAHATARCFPEWQFMPMEIVCFPAAKCSSILAETLRLTFDSHSRKAGWRVIPLMTTGWLPECLDPRLWNLFPNSLQSKCMSVNGHVPKEKNLAPQVGRKISMFQYFSTGGALALGGGDFGLAVGPPYLGVGICTASS